MMAIGKTCVPIPVCYLVPLRGSSSALSTQAMRELMQPRRLSTPVDRQDHIHTPYISVESSLGRPYALCPVVLLPPHILFDGPAQKDCHTRRLERSSCNFRDTAVPVRSIGSWIVAHLASSCLSARLRLREMTGRHVANRRAAGEETPTRLRSCPTSTETPTY
jgi:hypothetical protein